MPVPVLRLSEYSTINTSSVVNSATFTVKPNILQDTSCIFAI